MLELLYDGGKQRYSDLITALHLSPSRDAGKFAYHLKLLLNAKLITTDKDGCYVISTNGEKIIEFCRSLTTPL